MTTTPVNTYNPNSLLDPKIPVSTISLKLKLKWKPRILIHTMLWFNTKGGSHLNIGYDSNDPVIIAGQIAYAKSRGVDVMLFQYYGQLAHPDQEAILLLKAECEKQGMNFAVGMDGGMFKSYDMPSGSTDVNAWAAKELQYVVDTFCSSPMYEKVADGRFLMLNFDWEGVKGLNAGALLAKYPQIAMLYQKAGGLSQAGSSGAFNWVGVAGNYNPESAIEDTAKAFLAATAGSKKIVMGSFVKGFDDHNRRKNGDPTKSCWDSKAPYRFADEKQGQTFLNCIDIYNNAQEPPAYMQMVTFNDHEEGTNFEWGIDSLLTVDLTVASTGIATVTLTGNVNTVDHLELYNGTALLASVPPDQLTFDLNTLTTVQDGQELLLQVQAVGFPFFQNKFSPIVKTAVVTVPGRTVNVLEDIDTTVTVDVTGQSGSLTLSGTVDVPIKKQGVLVPVVISTQTVWS